MKYNITILPAAEKGIRKLPKSVCLSLCDLILNLSESPRPSGVKKLKAKNAELYRARLKNYRAVYEIGVSQQCETLNKSKIPTRKEFGALARNACAIKDKQLKVIVVAAGHRKNIYPAVERRGVMG